MEKHTCKLCNRSFANGRALGGHMRSHVTASTKVAAVQIIKDSSSSSPPSASSSSSRDDDDVVDQKGMTTAMTGSGSYGLRENPKKSFKLVDPEFSSPAAGSFVIVQDRESETESSRVPTHRRRSKRARKAPQPPQLDPSPEPEPVSSVSDTTPEEDVAISLMMLSRDIWCAPKTKTDYPQSDDEEAEAEDDDEEEQEIEIRSVKEGRSKYQCGTCKKVFRSYQALGGHRASRKKTNGCVPPPPAKAAQSPIIQIHEISENLVDANAEKLHHVCPVCYRVFSSGQALGGHKRSHLTSSTTTITITSSSPSVLAAPRVAAKFGAGESLIDLNLPAPMEEDAEPSAVSDAEFVIHRSS